MQKEDYAELLRSPLWQKKRLEIMQRDNFTCCKCGCTHKELQVHHIKYIKGRKPWEYDNEDLVTLCNDCHEKHHFNKNLEVVNDIRRGDWYMNWSHEFRTYAVVFDVDVMKKVIHLFGMNEGSFGSPWIFSVPYKEFSQEWEKQDMWEEDEDGESLYESGYFVGSFMNAYDWAREHGASFVGREDSILNMDAVSYVEFMIRNTPHLKEYCNYNGIYFEDYDF